MTCAKSISKGLVIVCVATVIAEGIGLGNLWFNGKLNDEKRFALLAALHGIDTHAIWSKANREIAPAYTEQAAFIEIEDARFIASMDLDLRETAIEKALTDLQYLEEQLKMELTQYENLKDDFDKTYEKMKGAAAIPELLEMQQTLQVLSPKQAKEQLLQLLGYGAGGTGSIDTLPNEETIQSQHDVIRMVKSMSLEHRKKIFAQFINPREAEQLGDILKLIRLGIPEMNLILETREKLEQFNRRLARG